MRRLLVCLCIALFMMGGAPSTRADGEAVKALRFGKLVDGKGKVWSDAIVIVRGDRIAEVTTDPAKIPAGAEVLDLRRYTAIPGLIDVHTHTTYYWDQSSPVHPFEQQGGPRLPAVTVFLAQENARRTLEAGVTTVRDLGSNDWDDIAMRDLINRGAMLGPRMFVAGYGIYVADAPPRPGYSSPPGGRADNLPDVMRVIREEVVAGVDVVKMYASTGTDQDLTGYQTYTFDEIRTAAEMAHKYGKRLAVHSYGPDGARDAVRAGADSIEHATDMDDATIAEMAKRGTFYVPTIDHNRYYAENIKIFGWGPEVADRLNDYLRRNVETARRAFHAGVRFAMGSDALFTMCGQNTRELGWFVKIGMTPQQALSTATSNAAALLGKENELGAVAPGYFADVVAVEGDPLADIDVAISHVRWVMKGGAVVVDRTAPEKK
ncbi:MAG TPA: amidohydrolase family protein [Candidatus Acidoferrales bacterium]|jgi:imidazolonepropionase-like amidohydrolase|nr:amidohydrolase family protein [Candidatus Acidoferrales bacterium]